MMQTEDVGRWPAVYDDDEDAAAFLAHLDASTYACLPDICTVVALGNSSCAVSWRCPSRRVCLATHDVVGYLRQTLRTARLVELAWRWGE